MRFHSEEKIGDAIFRMFQDSAAIPHVINGLIVQPVMFFPAAIGSILYLVWYDYRLALIALLLMPANFILAWLFANSLRAAFIAEREATAQATTRIEETLASIRTVKAFGTEAARGGSLRARQLGRVPGRAPRAPDARALSRHHQHRARSRLRCRDVLRRDGSDGGRQRGSRARCGFARDCSRDRSRWCRRVSARTRNITDLWGSMQDVVVAISRVLEMLGQTPEHSVSSGHAIPPKAAAALALRRRDFRLRPARRRCLPV